MDNSCTPGEGEDGRVRKRAAAQNKSLLEDAHAASPTSENATVVEHPEAVRREKNMEEFGRDCGFNVLPGTYQEQISVNKTLKNQILIMFLQ